MRRPLTPVSSFFSHASIALRASALALVVACGGSEPAPEAPPQPPPPPPAASTMTPPVAPTASAAPSASDTAPPPAAAPTPPAPVAKITGFSTPESVFYDEASDRYLVSNINGTPFAVDNNGFISEVKPDGTVSNMKWIEGGKNKVTLNAPKGMAIAKGVLYVADINTVRMFDAKSGAPKGEIKLTGATFANDVAASDDGSKVYVSDSGLKPDGQGFGPTGTDAVWLLQGGKAKAFAKSTDLGRPNGVLVDGDGVIVVSFASSDAYRLDASGKKQDVTKLPKGGLDGVVKVGDQLYVSSWEGSAVYKGKLGGTFEPAFTNLTSPADIGFDKKRSRLLVPHFTENTVEIFEVK